MKKILLSWIAFKHDFKEGDADPEGPTMSFHQYFYEEYERHFLLHASDDANETRKEFLLNALKRRFPSHQVEPKPMDVPDIIDLEAVQSQIEPLLLSLRDYQIDIFISPGTPTMHAAWVLAHVTLNLHTRLLQVRPKEFTSDKKKPELLTVKIKRDPLTASAIIRQDLQDSPHSFVEKGFCMAESLEPVYEQAQRVAGARNTTVLILGETGVGKEHLAHFIHQNSSRRKKPFEAVNCSALGDELLESRLFGYKKGSFTGATADKPGILESTEGGTIFLDEIGDITPYMQQVLLRTLQEKEIAPIGGPRRKIDLRFISATNKDLRQLCEQGTFRWDLYYRLAVIELRLPSLQERGRNEKKELIQFLIQRKQRDFQRRKPLAITQKAMDILMSYTFPGNIRELENLIERLYVLCQEGPAGHEHFPDTMLSPPANASLKIKDVERLHIERVLRQNDYNQRRTARDLGVVINTLRNKIRRYRIEVNP